METIIIIVLVVVFGIPIFMNTLGPFIIWKTQKLPAVVRFEPLEREGYLQDRNAIFKQYDKALTALGFASIGASVLKNSNSDSYFSLYWHGEQKVAAMVVTIKSKVEEMTYLEISQKYRDGTSLDVSNSKIPGAYPSLDFKLAFRYPKLVQAEQMLEAHKVLREKYKGDVTPVDYDVSKGFYEVEKYLRMESDILVSKGLIKEEIDSDGKRALTLYGAMVLTFRSVLPGKNIIGFISERRAEAALKNP